LLKKTYPLYILNRSPVSLDDRVSEREKRLS